MEEGTVKFFLADKSKRYGFITMSDGREVFFHSCDGETFENGGRAPVFSGKKQTTDPAKGNRLVFQLNVERRGLKAAPWGFYTEYKRIQDEIAAFIPTMYRVVRQQDIPGNPPGKPAVLWEGSDIDELCRKYPRPEDRRMDELAPSFSCGDFDQWTWFEQQVNGEWTRCDDPRPVNRARMSRGRWK